MDFISDMLNCDVGQLRPIDDTLLQQEVARISACSKEKEKDLKCNKCGVGFSHAKSLSRHLKNGCSKQQFICSDCGKTYEKKSISYETQRTWEMCKTETKHGCCRKFKEFDVLKVRN